MRTIALLSALVAFVAVGASAVSDRPAHHPAAVAPAAQLVASPAIASDSLVQQLPASVPGPGAVLLLGMTAAAAIGPKKQKPAPAACYDCSRSAKPGEKVPVPVLESETEKQRNYRCPKCGLPHIVGNPASTYGS